MKSILEKISIVIGLILEPSHFPKKIAIELLITMPQMEPQISDILYNGYSIPKPIDARNVLSPSSPIAIVNATINTVFLVNEVNNLIIHDLESVFSVLLREEFFLSFQKPITPKSKKEQYVKIFK